MIDDPKYSGLFDLEVIPDSDDYRFVLCSILQNAVPFCDPQDINPDFAQRIVRVWRKCPFVASSAYRSPSYEVTKGRSGKSSHCRGMAMDIACLNNAFRFELISTLLSEGFNRLGIAKNFIHVDCDDSKIPNCIWTYDDHNKERKQ